MVLKGQFYLLCVSVKYATDNIIVIFNNSFLKTLGNSKVKVDEKKTKTIKRLKLKDFWESPPKHGINLAWGHYRTGSVKWIGTSFRELQNETRET